VHKALYGLLAKLSIEVVAESRGNPLGPRYRVFKWQDIDERRKAAGIRIDTQSKRIVGIPAGILPTIPNTWDTGIPASGIPSIPNIGMVIKKEDLSSESAKTDDEAFASLRSAMTAETGRQVSAAALAELDELLTAEFKLAAGRADGISAPGAFFAEHLRRRLWKKEKRQIEEEGKAVSSRQAEAAEVDASKCPDCFGTGMYYPGGFEKGVARCHHEKLTVLAASAPPTPASEAHPPTDSDLVEMATGFLHQGLEIEAIGQLLAASIDAEHWPHIRAAALERYEREREQTRPPTTA
jgi:hypothetical protein